MPPLLLLTLLVVRLYIISLFIICGIVCYFFKKKLLKALAAPQLCSAAPPHAGMEFHEVSPAEEEEIRGECWGKLNHILESNHDFGKPEAVLKKFTLQERIVSNLFFFLKKPQQEHMLQSILLNSLLEATTDSQTKHIFFQS